MHPVLFSIFGIDVHTFGVCFALAFVLGTLWIVRRGVQTGHAPETYQNLMLLGMIGSLLGARGLYLVYFWQDFLQSPLEMLLSRGGLVWYGGVIGFLVLVLPYAFKKKLNFWQVMDVVAPPAALGLAIGRLGCWFAGCCYGGPCALPWAVQYPVGHETFPHWVHPAPLYESGLAFLLMTLMLTLGRFLRLPMGSLGLIFFSGYALIRFSLEYVRGDRLIWLPTLDLSASQVISLVIAGIVLVVFMQRLMVERSSSSNPNHAI